MKCPNGHTVGVSITCIFCASYLNAMVWDESESQGEQAQRTEGARDEARGEETESKDDLSLAS